MSTGGRYEVTGTTTIISAAASRSRSDHDVVVAAGNNTITFDEPFPSGETNYDVWIKLKNANGEQASFQDPTSKTETGFIVYCEEAGTLAYIASLDT